MTFALRAYTILLVMALSQSVAAQVRPVGVIWHPPASSAQARAEIELMRQHGIMDVYSTEVPSDEQLQLLRNYQIRLLAQQPIHYLTAWYLDRELPRLKNQIQENWSRLRAYPFLRGYSLFFEGALFRPDFIGSVSELRPAGMPEALAYYSSDIELPDGYSVPMARLGLVQTIEEAKNAVESNPDLSYVILVQLTDDQSVGQWYELLKSKGTGQLFLSSDIFFVDNEFNSALRTLIKEIQSDPEYLLPMAETEEAHEEDGYSIFVFLTIMVIFGIHYAFDPTYRKSLQRFFQSNRIFVDDLVQRRAKLTFSNYIVMMYILLLSGTFVMAITEFKVSRSGVELLSHFVPFLGPENVLLFGFLTGVAISTTVLGLLIPWGAYMNKGTAQFMGYVTIILWPNHILFMLVLLSIVLARIFNAPYIAAVLSLFVAALPILSYSYGGFKLIRYSFRSGLPYLFLYFVPPFVLLFSLVWWLQQHTPLFQLAELTIQLP